MKTNVQPPSIDCFYGRVQHDKSRQQNLILSVMELGRSYTGQELSHATGLTPNVISARLFELRESGQLIRPATRKVCPFTKVSVFVHCKPVAQAELEFA